MNDGFEHLEEVLQIMKEDGEEAAMAYAAAHREELEYEYAKFAEGVNQLCKDIVELLRPLMASIVEITLEMAAVLEEAGYQLPDDDAGPTDEAGVV